MTKQELKALLAEEMLVYGISKKNMREKRFRRQKSYMIWQTLKRLRVYGYRCDKRDSSNNPLIMHIEAFAYNIRKESCTRFVSRWMLS